MLKMKKLIMISKKEAKKPDLYRETRFLPLLHLEMEKTLLRTMKWKMRMLNIRILIFPQWMKVIRQKKLRLAR